MKRSLLLLALISLSVGCDSNTGRETDKLEAQIREMSQELKALTASIAEVQVGLQTVQSSVKNIETVTAPVLPAVVEGKIGEPLENLKLSKGSGSGFGGLDLTTHLVTISSKPWTYDAKSRLLTIAYNFQALDDKQVTTYCAQVSKYAWFGQGWWLFFPDGRRLTAVADRQLYVSRIKPSKRGTKCQFRLPKDFNEADIPKLKFGWVVADSKLPHWPKDKFNRMLPSVVLELGTLPASMP